MARERFEASVRAKVETLGSEIVSIVYAETDADVAAELGRVSRGRGRVDVVLTAGGGSTDPLDPFFVAIDELGGEIVRRGVPSHPGSMVWLARLGRTAVLGLPTCGAYSKATAADLAAAAAAHRRAAQPAARLAARPRRDPDPQPALPVRGLREGPRRARRLIAAATAGGQWTDVQSRGDGCPTPPPRRLVVSSGLMRPSPVVSPAARPEHAQPAATPAFPATPPRPPTDALVGRAADLAAVLAALTDPAVRIVTLAGPGGAGKSRLAIEAARAAAPAIDGRVAWIGLAAIRSDEQVASELASGVGLADVPAERLAADLRETLGGAPALVVLDDAEHVIDGVRDVANALAGIPGLRLLVTTTTPLACAEERVIAVEPLAPPADDADPATLADEPAVRLLIDRATAAGATIQLTPTNVAVLARIVRRLDGLPLAIELAGAMLRILAPYQLLDRLDARLDLAAPASLRAPGSGQTARDDRHRSLRATMDWSHDLLAPEVQCLYRRLGVFSGAFGTERLRSYLERSLEHGLTAPAIDPEAGIAALVSASLLRVRPAPPVAADAADARRRRPEPRYELLGIVRDDAARRLAESGEAVAANGAHANDLLRLAERRHADLVKQLRPDAMAELDDVHEDLVAVLDRARRRRQRPVRRPPRRRHGGVLAGPRPASRRAASGSTPRSGCGPPDGPPTAPGPSTAPACSHSPERLRPRPRSGSRTSRSGSASGWA